MNQAGHKRALAHCGWMVGVSYCAPDPAGVTYDHLHALLGEMAGHGMNYLSLMMQSYAYFDPVHDGYAWPVKNHRLAGYTDEKNINARKETEFISKILDEARKYRIEVEMTLNWGIWNNSRITAEYPDACIQQDKRGHSIASLHCPDSPGAWQLGLDEVADLLSFYGGHPALKRFAFERVGYAGKDGCYCPHTREAFSRQHGATSRPLDMVAGADLVRWKVEHIGEKVSEYASFIKMIRPGTKIGCSSVGNMHWGHDPAKFHEWGVDYVQPHTIQFKTKKRHLYRTWARLDPNPMILHFDLRDRPPHNYPIWQKTPKIIKDTLYWVKNAPATNIDGILFFNEPVVPLENRQAAYDALDSWFEIPLPE